MKRRHTNGGIRIENVQDWFSRLKPRDVGVIFHALFLNQLVDVLVGQWNSLATVFPRIERASHDSQEFGDLSARQFPVDGPDGV